MTTSEARALMLGLHHHHTGDQVVVTTDCVDCDSPCPCQTQTNVEEDV